jgi:glycosyltransferase involved in cell wall biosynthesis
MLVDSMERRPLRIACIAGSASTDAKWVWVKDILTYPHPLVWRFFFPSPPGRIDRFLGRPFLSRIKVGLKLRRAVSKGDVDLIVSHTPYYTAWMAALLFGVKSKIVHLAFAFNFTDLPGGRGKWFMRRSFRYVDRFVVFSTMEKQLYGKYFGIPEEKFERIAWGVAPPIDQPGPRQIDERYVVSMGSEARDYATFLETARAMKDTIFVLIVRPHNLLGLQPPPNVKIFTSLPWKDAWNWVYHSALVVIPLRSAATPNGHVTLVGGMHLGKAHVVTASNGVADYITHNETALTVPTGDAAAMQAAIESLLSNPGLANRLGAAAKTFAEANCSESVTADFFVRFLDRTFPDGPVRHK